MEVQDSRVGTDSMGKSHRDNHQARLHRGDSAFALKKKRKGAQAKRDNAQCSICGGFHGKVLCPTLGKV